MEHWNKLKGTTKGWSKVHPLLSHILWIAAVAVAMDVDLRACLVKVRVTPFVAFWRTRRTYLIALFGSNASKN